MILQQIQLRQEPAMCPASPTPVLAGKRISRLWCVHMPHTSGFTELCCNQTTPPPFRPLDGSEGRRCALYGFTSCCCCRRGNLGSFGAADEPVIDLETDAGGVFGAFCISAAHKQNQKSETRNGARRSRALTLASFFNFEL